MKAELLTTLESVLTSTGMFQKVYKNYAPMYNTIQEYPAASIIDLQEERSRVNSTNNNFDIHGIASIYIYGKYEIDSYEDVLSSIIETVSDAINNSSTLQNMVIDAYVMSVKKDGTLLYPFAMSELTVYINYRDAC